MGLKETLYHGALFENDNRNFFWAQMIIKLNLIEIMEKNVESFEAFRECLDDQYQTDSVQTTAGQKIKKSPGKNTREIK